MVDKADSPPCEGDAALEYVTPEEMSDLERGAAEYGLGVKELMENAGRGVAEFVLSRFGAQKGVCVVCGRGNNGGTGSWLPDTSPGAAASTSYS